MFYKQKYNRNTQNEFRVLINQELLLILYNEYNNSNQLFIMEKI